MEIKNEVLSRVYILLFGIFVPIAVLLMYKTLDIAVIDRTVWLEKREQNYLKTRTIEPERGSIMAEDGSLLATSEPFFDLFFDPFAATADDYFKNLDTLAACLARYVDPTYTIGGYRDRLFDLRDTTFNKSRHVPLKKGVSYAEKKRIEAFPLFNKGQYRGGLIAQKQSERKRPFGMLARRTIGYKREDGKSIGLEGYFEDVLGGEEGKQVMFKVDARRNLWMPMEDLSAIQPETGDDIVTAIDINIQDIAERALMTAMVENEPDWGTAIVMEVKTGKIRAIANLGKLEGKAEWYEIYNYAIGRAVEPGSTFKLATMMALLEDDFVTLEDSVDIEKGTTSFYDIEMVDSSPESFRLDTVSVRKAFEISSNVGMAKLMNQFYGTKSDTNDNKGAALFIEKLRQFKLDVPTGIELEGEATPFIKEAYSEDDQWSGITLPWMSTGYEVKLTPLQLLNFFNTVANGGQMMKPYLVTEIRRYGETIEEFRPTVIDEQIASPKTLEQAQQLLKGVVSRGTAKKLQSKTFDFAGKTGTAQINYKRGKKGTRVGGYQASFAGYFPAENPVYSCIVVINRPTKGKIYGGEVAGPVFKEIAEKCFATLTSLHKPINQGPKPIQSNRNMPVGNVVDKKDFNYLADYLNITAYGNPSTEMVRLQTNSDSLFLQRRTIVGDKVPNVYGMGLRDALFILENLGLKVQVNGVGRVINQSIKPGTIVKGQTIELTMN